MHLSQVDKAIRQPNQRTSLEFAPPDATIVAHEPVKIVNMIADGDSFNIGDWTDKLELAHRRLRS